MSIQNQVQLVVVCFRCLKWFCTFVLVHDIDCDNQFCMAGLWTTMTPKLLKDDTFIIQ